VKKDFTLKLQKLQKTREKASKKGAQPAVKTVAGYQNEKE